MGTTGAGKTTVGSLLAESLGWPFADADDFHSSVNIEKMRAGTPLTDADREPWLESLREAIVAWLESGRSTVLACSALKRAYRLKLNPGAGVVFVYLKGSFEEIEERIGSRTGHFANRQLLASQFEALEEPGPDEEAITVSVSKTAGQAVTEILAQLGLEAATQSGIEDERS